MTPSAAQAYLAGLSESRVRPGLERIKKVLAFLGLPHLQFPHVLIGGTNGKGSVVAMMGAVLENSGLRVGRYTSPHLNRFEERIAVDGVQLDQAQTEDLVDKVRSSGIDLTYFEVATAMALLHFKRLSVDIALLEVGLGGRWDATNATDPVLSVITSVDLDHMGWLGDSIEKISIEKSMIMRPFRPVVINGVGKKALEVLVGHAATLQCPAALWGRDFSAEWEEPAGTLHYSGGSWDMRGLSIGLKGRFQAENAATSLAALESLHRMGFPVTEEAVARGFAAARWPGRFEELNGDPRVIVDSAHNQAAAEALVRSLDPDKPVVWLIACLKDKDLEGMAVHFLRLSNRFVLVPIDHPRACSLDEMAGRMPAEAQVVKASTVTEGLRNAVKTAGKGGIVVAAGSIILAAAVLREVKERNSGSDCEL